jgi:xanthine dehydrogenase large subunit
MVKGDAKTALASAPNTLTNTLYNKGQEHFYLESQVSYAVPTDDGGMTIYTSSQHPSEVQKLVAEVLGVAMHKVTVLVRRMGGGFGGKETQAAPWACLAAVLAVRNKRPVKLRLDRQDDMVLTGKRHDFFSRWTVGFNNDGRLIGADIHLAGLCGFSPDLSDAIVDRAMFHVDNAYNFPAMTVLGQRCKTNTVSNTAFRGFGGPQGMIVGEAMMDDIARATGLDPLDVRLTNLYQNGDKTHYGQPIEDFHIERLITQLERECEYRQRRQAITKFNQQHPYLKRGLALTPVRFGISFTVQHLNQAGALINIYTDGSIQINHGGTEMGQGLFTKVAQVVANEFSLDLDYVQVTATATDKVPNTSPTAASSGSDLNGKAAQAACQTIKERLVDLAVEHFGVAPDDVHFINNHVVVGVGESAQWFTFAEFVQLAYEQRVSLSATGYYRTPKIFYDRDTASGRPFYYYALGASCSEVEIDTLTGEYRILRTDILHDVGASLSPAIDIGQIEGGFVQGMGWLTTEELTWDAKGKLASASAATYKIPTSMDVPSILNVRLFDQPNAEETIYNSKAVGEPPLMHGIAVWCALRDAAASVANYAINPPLDTPATPERVLAAVMACQAHNKSLEVGQVS